jgi:methylglutaconyl-CoA hydratase
MLTKNTTDQVLIAEDGDVLSFTLNNPDAGNEVTGAMFDAMTAALAAQATRPTARVLRLSANGKAFCTGRERAGKDAVSMHAEVSRLIGLKKALRATPLISIAEVQGDAHGFGMGLAILCDFSLVSSTAALAFPEMRKGLPPAAIMAYLGHYALPKKVFPWVLFGEAFTPADAKDAGLVGEVVEPGALAGAVDALVAKILRTDPTGARHCKAFFQAAEEGTLDQNFKLATETLVVSGLRLMDAAKSK